MLFLSCTYGTTTAKPLFLLLLFLLLFSVGTFSTSSSSSFTEDVDGTIDIARARVCPRLSATACDNRAACCAVACAYILPERLLVSCCCCAMASFRSLVHIAMDSSCAHHTRLSADEPRCSAADEVASEQWAAGAADVLTAALCTAAVPPTPRTRCAGGIRSTIYLCSTVYFRLSMFEFLCSVDLRWLRGGEPRHAVHKLVQVRHNLAHGGVQRSHQKRHKPHLGIGSHRIASDRIRLDKAGSAHR